MKHNIIILLLLTLLLSGCGLYNLDGFVMPDNMEFIAVVGSLDTPGKIVNYIEDNFTYQYHSFYLPSPYQLWLTKEGDCNDFSTFGVFVADYHGYPTYQIKIYFKGTLISHTIAVYREDKLSYSENYIYCYGYDSFREIVIDDMEYRPDWALKSYKVYNYVGTLIEVGN